MLDHLDTDEYDPGAVCSKDKQNIHFASDLHT